MSKKKTEKTDKPKPKKVKKPKPEYIHNGDVKCQNCDDYNTEFKDGDWHCLDCGYIIKGIVLSSVIGLFIYIFL